MFKKSLLAASMGGVLLSGGAHAYSINVQTVSGWPNTTGIFDDSASEIVAYDKNSARFFVTNSSANTVDVLSSAGAKLFSINVGDGGPNSVAVNDAGLVAVAVEASTVTDPGSVKFYNADGVFQGSAAVGALPDMVTFAGANTVLVANEAEASGGVNPVGSISIIDITGGAASANVQTADFSAFNSQVAALDSAGVRLFPDVLNGTISVAQDLEPEYIAVAPNGTKAFVTLQEANAVAVVDIASATVTEIQALGYKDHSLPGNGLDPSDRDGGVNINTYPIYGMYMPDAISTYEVGGTTYYLTANEGDDRGEDARIKDLVLDTTAFPDAATLQQDAKLGRLAVATDRGDTDGDGDYDALYAYGARSFSIFDEFGNLVFDSGDQIEQITGALFPNNFNASNDDNGAESRSDAKGPEPEALTIGEIDGIMLAFVGLERIGGVMIFDITDPGKVAFVDYFSTRDFSGDPAQGTAGDLGPEGLLFIPAAESFNGRNLLAVANEVSGTTNLFEIDLARVPAPATLALLAVGGLAMRRRLR